MTKIHHAVTIDANPHEPGPWLALVRQGWHVRRPGFSWGAVGVAACSCGGADGRGPAVDEIIGRAHRALCRPLAEGVRPW